MAYTIEAEVDGHKYTFESDTANPSEADILDAVKAFHEPAQAPAPEPSRMERFSQAVLNAKDKVGQFVGPTLEKAGMAATGLGMLANPIEGLSTLAANQVAGGLQDVSSRLGGFAPSALMASAMGAGPATRQVMSGAAGLAINPLNFVGAGEAKASMIGAPVVPAERAAAVQAAQDMGVPLSRGEMTGSRALLGAEAGLEKTLTGSAPITDFRSLQAAAIQRAADQAKAASGTAEAPLASGMRAKEAFDAEKAAAKSLRDELYAKVPDNVNIPLNETAKVADELIKQQSEYMPSTRNSDVTSLAKDIQDAVGRRTPGASYDVHGVTEIPKVDVPGSAKVYKDFKGDYQVTDLQMPKTVDGKPIYGVKHSAAPEELPPVQPNWAAVKRLRETLNAKIKGEAGKQVVGDYIQLKQALDNDINAYVNSAKSPLDSMVANQFRDSFKAATSFNREFKAVYGDNPLVKRLEKAKAEDMPQIVFGGGRVEDVLTAKMALGEQGFSALRQQFFNDLVGSKNIPSELAKYDPSFLRSVLRPQELKQLSDLGKVKGIALSAEKMGGSQGSARTNSGVVQGGAIGAALLGAAKGAMRLHPAAALGGLATAGVVAGVPRIAAKALVSEAARTGLNVAPAINAAGQAGKLAAVNNPDNRRVSLQRIRDFLTKRQ